MTRGAYNTWMPLYVADYLRKTSRLTTEQHGAYCLLIMDYWVNGMPPDDDTALAQIVRLPLNTWRKHRPVVQPYFSVKDGKWIHDRIEEERMKAFALTEVRRKGGQERQRLSKEAAQAEAAEQAGRAARRPAEKLQAARPLTKNLSNNLPSLESGSAREAAGDPGGPQPRRDAPDEPKALGSFTDKIQSRLLEAAAGKKF